MGILGLRGTNLYAWGYNSAGQLGLNDQNERLAPTLVGSGFTDISAGEYHSLAVKSDGVYAWGNSQYCATGLGSGIILIPTKVLGGTGFKIFAGLDNSFIIQNGIAWGSGANGAGQLGVGDTTQRNEFVMIGNLTIKLNETNSDADIFTDAIKSGWVDQKAYLYLNSSSVSAVSLVVNRSGVVTNITIPSGISQHEIDLTNATGFGISGTDYEVEIIEFAIGQYGIKPVWYEGI